MSSPQGQLLSDFQERRSAPRTSKVGGKSSEQNLSSFRTRTRTLAPA